MRIYKGPKAFEKTPRFGTLYARIGELELLNPGTMRAYRTQVEVFRQQLLMNGFTEEELENLEKWSRKALRYVNTTTRKQDVALASELRVKGLLN